MRCQNTNPEFVKFVEEYLNSEDAYDLVFMPNFSISRLYRKEKEKKPSLVKINY